MSTVKGLDKILEAFDNGYTAIFKKEGITGRDHIITIHSEEELMNALKQHKITVRDLVEEVEINDKREFHLYFDYRDVPVSGMPRFDSHSCLSVASTLESINGANGVKPHEIRTTMVNLCTLSLLDKGFRIFIHPQSGFGDVFEITLGSCDRTDREIRPAHNLPNMLMSGEFGKLFESKEGDEFY